MKKVRFGKVENNPAAADVDYAPSIEMGISHAPARLIVKYITDMYSHPFEAAVRETVANAFDASKAKNGCVKDVSARIIKTPYGEKNIFEVRDDGHGMTYDKLVNVYTQYGVSDKRDDEELTGAFGLGAKSPLAYTNHFSVLTCTAEEGCYYVHAYRTPKDDFLAAPPLKIERGGFVDTTDPLDGKPIHVENPFSEGETGTIVKFPINRATEDEKRNGRTPESVIRKMSEMIYCTAGFSLDGTDRSADKMCYHIGDYMISDDDGNEVKVRLLIPALPDNSVSDLRMSKKLDYFANASSSVDTRSIAFKVDNWLYPSDGSAWLMGNSSLSLDEFALIVEVPSRALSFVPSRDTIISDAPSVTMLRRFAVSRAREKFADTGTLTDIFNWAMGGVPIGTAIGQVLFKVGYDVEEIGPAIGDELKVSRYSDGRHTSAMVRRYSFNLDAPNLVAFGDVTLGEALTTERVFCGHIHRSESGQVRMKNGPLLVSSNLLAMVFGDGYDPDLSHSNAVSKAARYSGYGAGHRCSIADAMTSRGSMDTESFKFASVAKSPYESPLVATIPYGLAIAHAFSGFDIRYSRKIPIFVIDAHGYQISKVRSSIVKVFAESTAESGAEDGIFLILPKKDEDEDWTDAEREDIIGDMLRMAREVSDFAEHVPLKYLKATAKKSKVLKTTSELEKMFRNNRVIGDANNIKVDNGAGTSTVTMTNGTGIAPEEIISFMKKNPKNWGVIVADRKYDRPQEVAQIYAQAIFAFKLMSKSENFVCLSSMNFNADRAQLLQQLGVKVVYDETGEGKCPTTFPKGTFSADPSFPLNRVFYRGEVSESIRNYVLSQESDKEESNIHAAIRRYLTPPTERTWGENVKLNAGTQALLDLFSFEMEPYELMNAPKMAKTNDPWLKKVDGVVEIEGGFNLERYTEMNQRLHDIIKIWTCHLSKCSIRITPDQLAEENFRGLAEVAKALGIDTAVEAYYNGVSLEHLGVMPDDLKY